MRHSDTELAELLRLMNRVESDDAKTAFLLLITSLYSGSGYALRPASQGNFAVLQIRIEGDNCFAFKGAKERLRFYFRKPCFARGPLSTDTVLGNLPGAEPVQDGEIAYNVTNVDDARRVLSLLDSAIH